MGTAMIKPLKTKAEDLMQLLGDKFTEDFYNNKKVIKSLKLPFSKINTNKLAGHIAKHKRKAKKAN